jgi:hypothetical protein
VCHFELSKFHESLGFPQIRKLIRGVKLQGVITIFDTVTVLTKTVMGMRTL